VLTLNLKTNPYKQGANYWLRRIIRYNNKNFFQRSFFFLNLLNDDLPLGVVREVVGFEKIAIEEGLQVLDVDLTSLEEHNYVLK